MKSVAEEQVIDGDEQAVQFLDATSSKNPFLQSVPLLAETQVAKLLLHSTHSPLIKTNPLLQAVTVFFNGQAEVLAAQAVQVAVFVK